ncbi:FAD binding domain-containing protein [Paraphaeosphaeria minitans]|uniref:FAD binding domain-containing protein n=1 Tax=Paraphaeosphaeria minitans TaxID=565426 RepID=A0A9P6KSI3_9PLEO|nr:FAD binding domain-containing protein [Paraphaeosphaeria minitans]
MNSDERQTLLKVGPGLILRVNRQETSTDSKRRPRRFSICLLLFGCFYIGFYFHRTSLLIPTANDTIRDSTADSSLPRFNHTCLPSQPCWPTTSQWAALNKTIHGNLKLTVPWAKPCYTGSSECQQVATDYTNSSARTSQYGAMEFLDWETCGQSSCMLDPFSPSAPPDGVCSLGRLSTYHVEAHSTADIQKTLGFTFRPRGCESPIEDVGEIGAGVSAQEAWEFFEPLGMLVTVGATGSVGIAGGFGQGGGHGPLGPRYGLMVDNAIEFDVVTADGQARMINACSDPDLFYAMRGGGGGTFAVLTSYKFQLHRAVPLNVYSFQASFPMPAGQLEITGSVVHRDIIRALASNQSLFASQGVAGYNFILPDHMVSLQILPSDDPELIKTTTSSWREFLTHYPGLNISENTYHTFSKFSEWDAFTQNPAIARNGPVGVGISESGRFLPKRLFSKPQEIEKVVDAVVTAMQISLTNRGGGSAQLYATGPLNQPDNSQTGVNPAFREAMWEVIMGGIWTSTTPESVRRQIRHAISASIEPFKALTPGGGCYMNEGDWTEEKWQQTFFGSNYDRLLEVKRRFDPTGLFNCWKCIGWSGYDDPMYSCYSQSSRHPNPTVPLGPVG